MRITTIPLILIVLSVIVLGLGSVFKDANIGLVGEDNVTGTYDRLNNLSPIYKEVDDTIKATGAGDSQGNFLVNLGSMWASVKIFFTSFGDVSEVTEEAAFALKVPDWLRFALLATVAILFLGLLINIAVRWKAS